MLPGLGIGGFSHFRGGETRRAVTWDRASERADLEPHSVAAFNLMAPFFLFLFYFALGFLGIGSDFFFKSQSQTLCTEAPYGLI